MRKRSFLGPLGFLTVCVAAVYLYFTPYLALKRLHAAAEAGDRVALERMVDFTAVRASIKDEVRGAVAEEIGREKNPLAALGVALAGVMADPLVDTFVTPGGIAAAVRGERPSPGGARGDAEREARRMEATRGYEGPGTFVVRFRDRETGSEGLALVMRRVGMAEWRLSAIRLPGGAEDER